jgi:hypothetical protein
MRNETHNKKLASTQPCRAPAATDCVLDFRENGMGFLSQWYAAE